MRRRGEGELTQLPNGTWRIRIMIGRDPVTGSKKRREFRGPSEADVRQQLLDFRLEERRLGYTPSTDRAKQTVAQFVERWLETSESAVAPRTHLHRCDLLRRHFIPAFGRKKLRDLRTDDLTRLYTAIAATSPSQPRDLHAIIRKMLNDALTWDDVSRNVARGARVPAWKPPERTPPSGEALRHLIDTADEAGDPFVVWYALAASGGFRPGELLGLTWAAVDWAARVVHIREARETRGTPTRKPLKSEKALRYVPLTRRAAALLRAHQDKQKFARDAAGPAWQANDLVFCTVLGEPIKYHHIYDRWTITRDRAGLPKTVRPYDLRHAFVTELLAEGIPLHEVSWLAGHASSSFTADTYGHRVARRDSAHREAIERAMGDV